MPVCKTCLDSLTCDTCFDTTFLKVSNVCECPSTLFFDINTNTCLSCATLQPNCLVCDYTIPYSASNPSLVICDTASPYYFITLAGSASPCMDYCVNCDPDNTACNSCKTNFTGTASCLCLTPTHFFNATTSTCQLCDDVIDGCTSCITQTIPLATTCNNCDPIGYYSPTGTYPANTCLKCHYLCQSCGLTGCTACINLDLSLITIGLNTVCGCNGG